MKKFLTIALTIIMIAATQSCGMRQLSNFKECSFKLQKVTSVSWAGINFMTLGTDYKNLDAGTLLSCTQALLRKDFSLNVGLNLGATNPGRQPAQMVGFDYMLYYGGQLLGEGTSMNTNDIVVPANGGSTVIPISFKLDLADMAKVKKSDLGVEKIIAFISDVAKVGKQDTDFAVKIRPHLRMGKKIVKGVYITIR